MLVIISLEAIEWRMVAFYFGLVIARENYPRFIINVYPNLFSLKVFVKTDTPLEKVFWNAMSFS